MRVRSVFAVIGLCVMLATACKHGKCEDGGSSSAGRRSHNAGEDCSSCHHPDGEGEGCWTIDGTIYDHAGNSPTAAAEMRLFSAALGKGQLKLQLQGDGSGNVYTSQSIDFGPGLFPAVIGSNGDTLFMSEAISDGACNRCHGHSTERIKLP
ncbi:MAG: hypothetical protein ABI432_00710 [Flavobacteriales bacterium]